MPRDWVSALAIVLGAGAGDRGAVDAGLIPAAVSTVRTLPIAREGEGVRALEARLLQIASDTAEPPGLRLDALAALPGGLAKPDQPLFDFLIDQIRPDRPVAARTTAADVLARAAGTGTT